MSQHVKMASNGRLVIPTELRAALGMGKGGSFLASLENGSVRLRPLADVVAQVQAEVRRYVPPGTSLADELIEERRREAERE